jgi:hypothetical protein
VEHDRHKVLRKLGVTRGPLLAHREVDTARAAPLVPLAPSASGGRARDEHPTTVTSPGLC